MPFAKNPIGYGTPVSPPQPWPFPVGPNGPLIGLPSPGSAFPTRRPFLSPRRLSPSVHRGFAANPPVHPPIADSGPAIDSGGHHSLPTAASARSAPVHGPVPVSQTPPRRAVAPPNVP